MAKTATPAKSNSPSKTRRADANAPGPAIVLNEIVNISFDKLRPSDKNVRRIKNGISIEELALDIGRRGLLQSLSVRALVNPEGVETGLYEVQAGGRRYKALERLVKQKRLAADTPVPCILRAEGLAEEDSRVWRLANAFPPCGSLSKAFARQSHTQIIELRVSFRLRNALTRAPHR